MNWTLFRHAFFGIGSQESCINKDDSDRVRIAPAGNTPIQKAGDINGQ